MRSILRILFALLPLSFISEHTAAQTNECGEYKYIAGNVTVNCDRETKFRFVYYRLSGIDPAFIARNSLPPTMDDLFEGKAYVLRNDVSRELRRLYRTYGGHTDFSFIQAKQDEDPLAEPVDVEAYSSLIRGDAYSGDASLFNVFGQVVGPSALAIRDQLTARRLVELGRWTDGLKMDRRGNRALIWRHMTRKDLDNYFYPYGGGTYVSSIRLFPDKLPGNYHKFLLELIGDNEIPEGFASVRYNASTACGDSSDFAALFDTRLIEVVLLSVENVGNRSLDIGPAFLQSVKHALSNVEDADQLLSEEQEAETPIFPIGILKPGEAIVVPVRLQLASTDRLETVSRYFELDSFEIVNEDQDSLTLKADSLDTSKTLQALNAELQPDMIPEVFQVSRAGIEEGQISEEDDRFVFGPGLKMAGLIVNGRRVDVRSQDEKLYASFAGLEAGSCPFFLYSSPMSRTGWYTQGTTLSHAVGRLSTSIYTHRVPSDTASIRISEIEDETSYIDRISFRQGGQELALKRNVLSKRWRNADNDYLILDKGDTLDLDLDNVLEDAAVVRASNEPIEVSIQGYYSSPRAGGPSSQN